MTIIEALRIEKGEIVAIVGAGGKTSLLFALAGAAYKPVCLTTTTKLMREEGQRIAEHVLFSDFATDPWKSFKRSEISLVTNSLKEGNHKWLGLSLSQADQLISFCRHKDITCLIEADGARHLPLKAPAEWEPVIPPMVDLVIVAVGLSAIGRPLNAGTVFREDIFSKLTGLPLGEPILLEHILRMLNHPEGGLKGIPPNSRAAVVFNQADAYSLMPEEKDMIRETLQGRYSAAILTSLRTDSENCEVILNRR